MPTSLDWVIVSILIGIRCILCVLIIYYAFRFHKFRSHQALQKRYPPLVYLTSTCIVMFLGFERNFVDIAFIYNTFGIDLHSINLHQDGHIFKLLQAIFYSFTVHGAAILLIYRAWIVYFNIHFGKQIQKQKWSVHINSFSQSSSWFIKHKKDFGSHRFITYSLVAYYVIETVLLWILFLFAMTLFNAIDSIFFLVEIITLIVIWIKTPAFYDIFGLKNELRYALYLVASGFVTYLVYIIVALATESGHSIWSFAVIELAIALCIGLAAIMFTSYIFYSKYKYLLLKQNDLDRLCINENVDQLTLAETLKDTQLIEAFFKHLSDEFSVELLLAFVEMIQFKRLMENEAEIGNINENSKVFRYSVCEEVPRSYIVFEAHKNVQNADKYGLIAKVLFDKYVNYSAEFEINISYSERERIVAFIKNGVYDKYELYTLYDNCIDKLYWLMLHSHNRFRGKTTC
eukprot:369190_1